MCECGRKRLCACVLLQLGAASEVVGIFYDGKDLIEPHPLNKGNERITENVAGLMCDEKANTRIGIIYTRINIVRQIIIFPILSCLTHSNSIHVYLFFLFRDLTRGRCFQTIIYYF